ncbi:hypothetical protein DFH27DRAFT_652915 [Peziza echinospora]|nr:hypothetical protein DFH27DRAFT_652915 [Peziza echinospora]
MDDLAGLSFSSGTAPKQSPAQAAATSKAGQAQSFGGVRTAAAPSYSSFSALRPTSATPPSRGPSPGVTNGSKPPTAAGKDSFASLVPFGQNKATSVGNLSLLEQQKRLQEQKARAEEEKRRQLDAQFGGGDGGKFWDTLAGQTSQSSAATSPPPKIDGDEDLFAAFRASAPVDKSSYYPPPSSTPNSIQSSAFVSPRYGTPNPPQEKKAANQPAPIDPFDELFGMGSSLPAVNVPSQPPKNSNTVTSDDNDDFLGLLGRPVSELPPPRPTQSPQPIPAAASEPKETRGPNSDPRDEAIAEIMDMGFSLPQARKALAETESGVNVQQAVSWLLNEAHRQSKSTTATAAPAARRDHSSGPSNNDRQRRTQRGEERRDHSADRRGADRQPTWARTGTNEGGEKDIAAIASEVGSNLFKSANSLWSQGKKKVGKAIQEFQQDKDVDDGTPKWMREAQQHQTAAPERRSTQPQAPRGRRGSPEPHPEPSRRQQPQGDLITDEALMLEAREGPPPKPARLKPDVPARSQTVSPAARQSPADIQRQRQMEFAEAVRRKEQEMRDRESAASSRRAQLTREAAEEPAAYTSPSRRKKVETPPPQPPRPVAQTGNLLDNNFTSNGNSQNPFLQQQKQQQQPPQPQRNPPPKQPTPTPPIQVRKQAPKRPQVPISSSALTSSTNARVTGSKFFKLGDYSTALTHYSTALNPVPSTHPLRILLLCNRAICNLKVGDSKACINDCEEALILIGEGRGEGETISLEDGTPPKEMKEFWEKAWARKAEGFEQLEKWSDAGKCWTVLVEAGAGGTNAMSGKRRCENALAPKAAPPPRSQSSAVTSAARKPPPPRRPATTLPESQNGKEAVNRLREANAQAENQEQEKLALYDSVAEKIQTWKGGKEGNLRALLTSLDGILWPAAGWKKVGMHELIIPQKVKIHYMKGIAKVHPDKIPVDATTEQRMISGTVFMLLNEAWDKFKVDNNL